MARPADLNKACPFDVSEMEEVMMSNAPAVNSAPN